MEETVTGTIIDYFFYACLAYGVVATLYYLIDAQWWRVEGWRLSWMIWRRRR